MGSSKKTSGLVELPRAHAFDAAGVRRSDEVGEKGQGHTEVVDAGNGGMSRVAVVDAEQRGAAGQSVPLGAQVIPLVDGEAPALIAGLGIFHGHRLGEVPAVLRHLAKQKPTALIRKRPQRLRFHHLPRLEFKGQEVVHASRLKVSWYLLASSANTVTTTPDSNSDAKATAPARFAAALGESNSPSSRAARRIMA